MPALPNVAPPRDPDRARGQIGSGTAEQSAGQDVETARGIAARQRDRAAVLSRLLKADRHRQVEFQWCCIAPACGKDQAVVAAAAIDRPDEGRIARQNQFIITAAKAHRAADPPGIDQSITALAQVNAAGDRAKIDDAVGSARRDDRVRPTGLERLPCGERQIGILQDQAVDRQRTADGDHAAAAYSLRFKAGKTVEQRLVDHAAAIDGDGQNVRSLAAIDHAGQHTVYIVRHPVVTRPHGYVATNRAEIDQTVIARA